MAASAKSRANSSSGKRGNGRSKAKPALRFVPPSVDDIDISTADVGSERKRPAVSWAFNEHGPNIHEIVVDLGSRANEFQMLLVSDMHWDNPHCDRKLLARHLDQAVARNAPILSAGDLFCAMQGKYDKRSDKSCVLPEHQRGDYLDALVRTAVDWFEPYGKHLVLLGDGNHECLDDCSEVLTTRGWVSIPDVTLDDKVCSLDVDSKAPVFAKPTKVHAYDYDGMMVHVNTRFVDMLMTPNHRICEYKQGGRTIGYRLAGSKITDGVRVVVPVSAVATQADFSAVTDDEIRLAGWMLTDGHFGKRWTLYQSKPKMVEKIDQLLSRLGVEFRKSIRERDITSICGVALKAKSKPCHEWYLANADERFVHLRIDSREHLPAWCWKLSRRQFDVLLEAIVDGNGSRHKSFPDCQMVYGKKEFLDDVQAMCVLHGYRAMLSERKRKVIRGTNGNYYCLLS